MKETLDIAQALEKLTVLTCVGVALIYFYNQYNKLKKQYEEHEKTTRELIIEFNEKLLKCQIDFSNEIRILQRDTLLTMNNNNQSIKDNTDTTQDLIIINQKLIDKLYE